VERLEPIDARLQRRHARADRGILGRAHARGERLDVRTVRDRMETRGRLHGAVEHLDVGLLGEDGGERLELAAAAIEAGVAHGGDLGALAAALRGAADLAAHRRVGGAVAVEERRHARHRRLGVRAPRPEECRAHPLPDGRVPHAGEVLLGVRARVAHGAALRPAGGRDGEQRGRGGGDGGHAQAGMAARVGIVAQRGDERVHRGVAIRRIGREAAGERVVHPRGHVAAGGRRGGRAGLLLREELRERLAGRLARPEREGRRAVEALVERHAEAVLIGGGARPRREVLLGRHVERRADEAAGLALALAGSRGRGHGLVERRGDALGRARFRDLAAVVLRGEDCREAEVGDAHAAVVAAEDVGRLDVAVHEALRVRGGEPARGVEVGGEHLAKGGARRALAPDVERAALHELHGDEDVAVVLADVVHLHHVGVRELAERPRLAEQHVARALRVGRGLEELQGHAALELGVVGRVDDAHAAAAEHREHHVAADGGAAREDAARRAAALGARALGRRGRADERAAGGAAVEVRERPIAGIAGELALEEEQDPFVVEAGGVVVGGARWSHVEDFRREESVISRRLRTTAKMPSHSDGVRWSRSIMPARVRRRTSSCAASIQRMAVVRCTPYMAPTRAGVRCSTKMKRRTLRSRGERAAMASRKAATKSRS
jgi:hypothetical protein